MKPNENTNKYTKTAILLNPIAIVIYAIACRYIADLAEYGGVARRLPVVIITSGLLLIWLFWFFFYVRKDAFKKKIKSHNWLHTVSKPWFYIALLSIVFITASAGLSIYDSAQPFHGKLSWVIRDLRNKRNLSFERKNLYTDGVYGFLEDMDEQLDLADEMYLSDYFSIFFAPDGRITEISGTIYGFNEGDNEERKSFRIEYDEEISEEMTVDVSTHQNASNENTQDPRLEILFDALSHLPFQEIAGQWPDESVYEIYYSGMRDFGYNDEGIIYYNQDEILGLPETIQNPVIGYTVSIYPPENEEVVPNRFVYTEYESLEALNVSRQENESMYDVAEESILNPMVSYQLIILDAALGSRFYGLTKTDQDAGGEQVMINEDPFAGETGVATGIHFINENLGFIGMSHNGGTQANLYRTEDGGQTFKKVHFPVKEVPLPLNEDVTYRPFDFPHMPFEEDKRLVLHVGQGADGDYNSGAKAVYYSEDQGETWSYEQEIIE